MDQAVKLTLRGREVEVRPLTLGQMQKYEADILALPDQSSPLTYMQKMARLLPMVAEAMGVSVEDAGAIVDIANFLQVWKALMNVSGLTAAPEGEAAPVAVN